MPKKRIQNDVEITGTHILWHLREGRNTLKGTEVLVSEEVAAARASHDV